MTILIITFSLNLWSGWMVAALVALGRAGGLLSLFTPQPLSVVPKSIDYFFIENIYRTQAEACTRLADTSAGERGYLVSRFL